MPHTKKGRYSMNPGYGKDVEEAEERSEKTGGGEVERITIRPAANGFTVECSYKSKPGKKGEMTPYPSEDHVFKTAAEVKDFVGKKLG